MHKKKICGIEKKNYETQFQDNLTLNDKINLF